MKKRILLLFMSVSLVVSLFASDKNVDVNAAASLGKTFTAVAKKTFPAVVVIENLQSPGAMRPSGLPPEFEFFFGRPNRVVPKADPTPVPVGMGSGVLIRKDGYIVTNTHVIQNAKFLRVKLKDGTVFDNQKDKDAVVVVGEDKGSDLAILKIKGDNYPVLDFTNSSEVEIGEWAIAIGAPFSWDYTLTVGVVSQIGRHNVFRDRVFEDYIQTDASINPGNSGGPLVNIHGDIIGINNFIASNGGSPSSAGIGFAISSNLVKRVSDEIIDSGSVKRPWLGISMADLNVQDRKAFKVDEGVLIREVMKGQPAEKSGVQTGDVIVSVGDKKVNTAYDVQSFVLEYKPGDLIPLNVKRDGKGMVIQVKASLRDASAELAQNGQEKIDKLGLTLSEDDGSVIIKSVDENSDAFRRNIKPGMKIISFNRVEVKSVEEFNKLLDSADGDSIMLKLEMNGKVFIEFLPLR